MSARNYSYFKSATKGMKMPFAWLDMDNLESNAKAIAARAGNKTVRIASKSIRSIPVMRHLLQMDDVFQGLLCYSGDEAVWLSKNGFDDLLIAYPVWHPAQVAAICEEVKQGKSIICMIDSVAHVKHLSAIAQKNNAVLPVCLDLDLSLSLPGVHFGVFRSPVNTVEKALAVFKEVQGTKHLKMNALMGYEAQVAGLGDHVPGQGIKGIAIRMLKKRSIKKVAERRKAVVDALTAAGADLTIVNGGGTGSMESTRNEACVTEIAAGSGFFQSHLFDYYNNFKHEPAAGFAVEIVRQPQEGIWTCHGGGYVGSGAPGIDKVPIPYLPKGAKLHPNEAAGEVQTPLLYAGPEKLALGDPVFFRHSKAGELCERFHHLDVIKDGKVVDQWATYRGEGQCFL